MRGKRGTAGQRAHALPMQESGHETWPRGWSSSQASMISALGSQTSSWQDLPGRQTVRAAQPRRREQRADLAQVVIDDRLAAIAPSD